MRSLRIALPVLVSLASTSLDAYEIPTHEDLSVRALEIARLNTDPAFRYRAGFLYPVRDRRSSFMDSQLNWGSLSDTVRRGNAYEDDKRPEARSKHHFYDPVSKKALWIDPQRWSAVGRPDSFKAANALNASARTSPDWMLSPGNGNEYSYAIVSQGLWDGYTAKDRRIRAVNLGKALDAIGRVIHHLQDMAQPQHVRNDAHIHDDLASVACAIPYFEVCRFYRDLDNPSTYEAWTLATDAAATANATYSISYTGSGPPIFDSPRSFWENQGRGISEFTSANFYSAGTLERIPPEDRGLWWTVKVSDLCEGAAPPCGVDGSDSLITFKTTMFSDPLYVGRGVTVRAAALSIYSDDFQRVSKGPPVWTVNRFVFEDHHKHLLPRAIAYSAGFIDFVFRGDMEITPPAEQVYSVVDTSVSGCGTPCGFRRIKLKLRNITPGNEAISAGKLRAVVHYRRNQCFRSDLSGNPGGPGFTGNQCRGPEEVSVSSEVNLPGTLSRTAPQAFTFNFTNDPIPINATEVRLQVVFRGKLGAEADAVAVTTLDTAEPTFIGFGNNTDYVFDDKTQRYVTAASLKDAPFTVSALKVGFATPGQAPVATLNSLGPVQHAQIAVLANKTGVGLWAWDGGLFQKWELADPGMEEFWFDETQNRYRATCPVWEMRGPHRQWVVHYSKTIIGTTGAAAGRASDQRTRVAAKMSKASAEVSCQEVPSPGAGGWWDFSGMTPKFSQSNLRRFTINF